ncbi:MAG TPA: hypothetical protein VKB31_05335 [Trueperaceae bacterium]|nr:hypothetical protein [Trueperaceae bacterium]
MRSHEGATVRAAPHGYAEAAAEPSPPRRRSRHAVAARGAHRVLTVLALVGSVHAMFLLGVEAWRFVQERQAVSGLQRQVGDLKTEARGLNQVIDHANDQSYREDLARRQGFMYPNELRAVTQEPPAAAPATQPASTTTTPSGP